MVITLYYSIIPFSERTWESSIVHDNNNKSAILYTASTIGKSF